VTRDDEITAIERYLSAHKPTICRSAYTAPTTTSFPPAEEARRLASVPVAQKSTHAQIAARMRKFYRSLRP